MDVAGARQRARELTAQLEAGTYGQERAGFTRPITVSDLVELFINTWCRPRNRRWHEQQRTLERVVCEEWGWSDREVRSITRRDVSDGLRMMVGVDGRRAIMANRVHAALHTMFRWSSGQGYLDTNPMLGMPKPAPERVRDRVLNEDEIRALWGACKRWRDGANLHPKSAAILMALLTGQRIGEIIGLHCDEVAADGLWRLPAARVKNKRDHVVPLPTAARQLLESCSARQPQPFGGKSINTKEKARLDGWMREQLGTAFRPWRLHDLRRTVRSGLAAAGVNWEIQHRIQNHLGPLGQMDRVYQRHDHTEEMAAGLAAWEARLMEILRRGI
jgi:integrase